MHDHALVAACEARMNFTDIRRRNVGTTTSTTYTGPPEKGAYLLTESILQYLDITCR